MLKFLACLLICTVSTRALAEVPEITTPMEFKGPLCVEPEDYDTGEITLCAGSLMPFDKLTKMVEAYIRLPVLEAELVTVKIQFTEELIKKDAEIEKEKGLRITLEKDIKALTTSVPFWETGEFLFGLGFGLGVVATILVVGAVSP
jgi:hypothetical protein